jgi:hypothetical protein
MMNQRRTWAGVLAALMLTGCTAAGAADSGTTHATGHAPARATGHVTGRLLMEGGPLGPGGQQPGERPIPGTVTFTAAGQRPVQVGVRTSGTFSVWLPPGRYRVAGRSPDVETVTDSGKTVADSYLEPWSVTVTARHTTAIQVVFIVP